MTELKQQALDKIAVELQTPHSAAEDQIHNWISDQEDEDLFTGILKEGKSFKSAFTYLINKASEVKNGNAAVMTDQEAYDHIRFYFLNEVKVAQRPQVTQAKVVTSTQPVIKPEPKPEPIIEPKADHKPKKAKVEMSMSIFDFIDDPNVSAEESEPDEDEDLGTDE
jgi:hypothetical protein